MGVMWQDKEKNMPEQLEETQLFESFFWSFSLLSPLSASSNFDSHKMDVFLNTPLKK
jgi:hypothetical protein